MEVTNDSIVTFWFETDTDWVLFKVQDQVPPGDYSYHSKRVTFDWKRISRIFYKKIESSFQLPLLNVSTTTRLVENFMTTNNRSIRTWIIQVTEYDVRDRLYKVDRKGASFPSWIHPEASEKQICQTIIMIKKTKYNTCAVVGETRGN